MTAAKLDPIDVKILDAIQRDGRITKLVLAEQVGLSPGCGFASWRRPASSRYDARIVMRVVF